VVQHNYFFDEYRVHVNSDPRRAILADGIEFVSDAGPEPACHQDGANVLFVDLSVQWQRRTQPHVLWAMDVRMEGAPATWEPGEAHRNGQPAARAVGDEGPGKPIQFYGSYGWGGQADSARGFSVTNTDGWYRRGWIPNARMDEDGSASYAATNGNEHSEMDDIYLCEGASPGQTVTEPTGKPGWNPGEGWARHVALPSRWNRFYGLRPHGRYQKPYGDKPGVGLSKRDAAIAGGALANAAGAPYRAGGPRALSRNWYHQLGHGAYEGWAWGYPGAIFNKVETE
jgi:prepilin-type processing-associated H-X9-DG protein